MIIAGAIIDYKRRDLASGYAEFRFLTDRLPQSGVDNCIQCRGVLRPGPHDRRWVLSGYFEGNVFRVCDDWMDVQSINGVGSIINNAAGDMLTYTQTQAIIKACASDVFGYFADDNNIPALCDICKRSKNGEAAVRQLVKNIRALARQEEFIGTLQRYGVPFDRIETMMRKGVTLEDINDSPYIVLGRYDVPLTIADTYARQECGYGAYDMPRCLGIVYAALRYMADVGHTCVTLEELTKAINGRYAKMLDGSYFPASIVNLCVLDLPKICNYAQIDGHTYIYITHIWEEECNIIHHVRRLQRSARSLKTDVTVDDTAAEIGINYNAGQRRAFELLKTSGIKILTGPPGSGKTATIRGLIHNYEANGNGNGTVHLAATTGMAARVMHRATKREAETANAMLRVVPYDDTVRGRDLNDPVDADLIIVDEISMMGLQMFSILVGAARGGSTILLVGDEHQLQSVEYGNVLHDLIASGEIEVCRLTEILRQSGTICANAARVNAGDHRLEQDGAFAVRVIDDRIAQQAISADYDPAASQVISPIKSGPMGTVALNAMLQQQLNGNAPIVAEYGRKVFRLGDRIIMTKNNLDAGYVNGDIGIIRNTSTDGDILVQFSGGLIPITQEHIRDMDLGYAITIHKSQGSEFPRIHIVLPERARHMMTRRLLYTAITRAKTQVIIYNQGTSLRDAIADRAETPRHTLLAQRLQAGSRR